MDDTIMDAANEISGNGIAETERDDTPSESFPECETAKARKLYFRQYAAAGVITAVLLLAAVVLLQVSSYIDPVLSPRLFQGIMLGYLIYHIIMLAKNRKVWNELFSIQSRCESVLDVFDDYFTLTTRRDGLEIARHRFLFSELRKVSYSGDLITVTARGQIFFLDKTQLPDEARFGQTLAAVRKETASLKPKDRKSVLLMIPGILSVVLTDILILMQKNGFLQDQEKFTPIFLVAFLVMIIFPIIWKIPFRKNRSVSLFNGIASTVTALLVLFFGLPQSTQVQPPETNDPSFANEAEEMFGLEFPETEYFYSYNYNNIESDEFEDCQVLRCATFYYDNGELNDFALNEHFIERVPTQLVGFTSGDYYEKGCALLLYNMDTGEYNTVPEKEGMTHFICVIVDRTDGYAEISDYYVNVIID